MIVESIGSISEFVAQHPKEILIWSNGFFMALALRRGRIEALLDKAAPVPGGPGETDEESK
jgi:hypothetical protein